MPSRTVRRTLASIFATLLGSDIAPIVSYVRLHGFTLANQYLLEGLLIVAVLGISVFGLILVSLLEVMAARYGTSGLASVWRAVKLIILPILATAYLSWLADPVFAYISLSAYFRPISILIVTSGMVVVANLVWTHESTRFLIVMNSQRTRFVVLRAAFIGSGVAAFCLATLTRMGITQQFASVSIVGTVGIAVLASIGSFLFLRWRRSRVQISAAHCYRVLKRIRHYADGGKYMFPKDAKSSDVWRESRILQYLASSNTLALDQSSPEDRTIPEGLRWPKIVPLFQYYQLVPESNRPAMPIEQSANSEAVAQQIMTLIIEKANTIWQCGGNENAWRALGAPMPKPPYQLFGSELDKLFNNGAGFIFHGAEGPRLVTMVLKGQPGAGKSTLALQTCVTLAKQGFICVYYSLEEEREGLLQSVEDFGWSQRQMTASTNSASKKEVSSGEQDSVDKQAQYEGVVYSELERGRSIRRRLNEIRKTAGKSTSTSIGAVLVSSLGYRAMSVNARTRRLRKEWGTISGELPRCVVIDSLEGFANVGLEGSQDNNVPREHLIALKDFFRDRCELLIILVEDDGSGRPGYVDFVADAVIQLGRRLEEDYTVLYTEVVKARNQTHALGKHQIKIRSEQDRERLRRQAAVVTSAPNESATTSGIQMFPSLHFRLSQAANSPTFDKRFLSSGLTALDTLLDAHNSPIGGLRRLTSNVLVGPSGTGKSVIALNFLVEGVRENTPTLLISLHDDPRTIMSNRPPQERHRIIFDWKTEAPKAPPEEQSTGAEKTLDYHAFTWTIQGVSQWVQSVSVEDQGGPDPSKLRRLPYLFSDSPTSYDTLQTDAQMKRQSTALYDVLKALSDEAAKHQSWDNEGSKAALQKVHDNAWHNFVDECKHSLLLSGAGAYKELQLKWDAESNTPYLAWDSRYWGKGGPDGKEQTLYDTTLLQIMYQRPGYVTPEEFIGKLAGFTGQPGNKSQFERVVLDDVAQIPLRFPLLAKSKLFLPTLLDILRAGGITTLFLHDDRSHLDGSSGSDNGLEIMADHVIRTEIRPRKLPPGETDDDLGELQPQVIVRSDAPPGVLWQPPQELTISRYGYVDFRSPSADNSGASQ